MNKEILELAAKELCKIRGQDPYEVVLHPPRRNANGGYDIVAIRGPAWKLTLREIETRLQVDAAIEYGKIQWVVNLRDNNGRGNEPA